MIKTLLSMESMYLLLLLAFSAANCEFSDYEREKLGCLLSPEICTPPEDCDGLTGSCQLPYDETEWRYQEEQPSLSDLVREMRSRGHDVNLEDVVRTLLHSRPLYEKYHQQTYGNKQYGGTDDNIHQVLSYLESRNQYNVPRELRRSVGTPRQRDPAPDENVGMDTDSTATMDEKRMQRMRELVDEAKVSLAKKGKRLSDLNPHEVKLLARHLSKIFKEEEQRKTANVEAPETSVDDLKTSVLRTSVSSNEPELEHTQELLQIPQAIEDSIVPKEGAEKSVSNEGDTDFEVQKKSNDPEPPTEKVKPKRDTLYVVIIVVGATVLLIILVTIISCIMHAYRTRKKEQKKFIGSVTSDEIQPFGSDYQELCRQLYASKNSETTQNQREIIDSSAGVQDPLITHTYPLTKPVGNGTSGKQTDADSLSAQSNLGRNSSVSSVSWSEEPVTSNLDITTGHAVLSYMEDHLNNKNRLDKEWEEICGYEADSITTAAAITPQNSRKNRSVVALPYDHNRIKLNPDNNQFHSDYINASAIIDNDPKRPLYIAAQGPLPSTIPDFWQMMWEQGCVAIVMLTPLVEEGVNQCTRYWPDEGSCTYHNFEIHLVSEHIWCEDYLVRSLYLKHLGTGSTRTVTQFHFLSWPKDRVPSTPKPLLELRRKVTKCYKGHNSPVLVHCSDGVGRTGTYILLDLAIDRMLKGAKEIDIAATLEHIRDQRVGMVGNRGQFEFALTAVAEEVNAILKTLLH